MKFKSLFASVLLLSLAALILITPVQADDLISYTSQPDEVVVFLNDIAFVRDSVALPGGVNVQLVLPNQIYQDTLILRENGERVANYRINHNQGQVVVQWESGTDSDLSEVTLEYLLYGISWTPKYDMWLGDDEAETVEFDFFAEIQNSALVLDNVDIRLVAGRVDTSNQIDTVSTITMNQLIVGYEDYGAVGDAPAAPTGAANIQHIYTIGNINAEPGDTVYANLVESTLPARRLLVWNAQTDQQVTVIYKVRNESELPFAEGVVRSYRNGLFIGSDFVEVTPIGSEGSVTVGDLQDVRVNRSESRTAVSGGYYDTQHEVELTISNFSDRTVELEVVDFWLEDAEGFTFSAEPTRDTGNIFRWQVTAAPGETVTITYSFKTS